MAKLIGTAGHVDHGKSTLIQALTGIDPDRLPEEKARGMTIDVGFAFVDLPRHGRVSIVDVPGHERFIHNMLVGALGVDVALLCVAADQGVMPQTREHLEILALLPVERLVVALTRADLADDFTRELAVEDVRELLDGSRFAGSPIVPVSAVSSEGMDMLRGALDDALDTEERAEPGPWYLPIDRAFTVKGHGAVVTGTLARGRVRLEERAVIQPGGLEVRVRGIQWHDMAQPEAEAGRRTALNLGGVRVEQIHRGMAVGAPGALFETDVIDLRVRWTAGAKHGMRVRLSIGADEAIGKLFLNDHDSELAQVRLERNVAAAVGQPAVLRRYSPPDVLGGGRVAVPVAKLRRRSETPILAQGSDEAEALIDLVGKAPDGLATEEACRALGRTAQDLGDVFERLKVEGGLLGYAGLWFAPETFEAAVGRLHAALLALHEAAPTKSTVPRDRALERARLPWRGKPLERIVAALAAEGRLRVVGNEFGHPEHSARLNARQRELLDRVEAELEREKINVPGGREVAQALGVPVQAVEEILRVGLDCGELVRVGEGIVFTRGQIEALAAEARAFGRPFSAAEFRDRLGTTRKYAIPVLEYFDAIRITDRVGDNRVARTNGVG